MLNLKWEDIELYNLHFDGKLDFPKFMESIDEKFNEKLKDINMEFELVDETIEVGNEDWKEDWKEEDGYIFSENDNISISFPMEFDIDKSEYHTEKELKKLVDSVNNKLKESIKESLIGLEFDSRICFVKEYLDN